jgi:hypothetical protein
MTPAQASVQRSRPSRALQEMLRRLDALRDARGRPATGDEPTVDEAERARIRSALFAVDVLATTATAGTEVDELSTEQTVMRAALAVLIERAGGQIEWTEADYLAVMKDRGPHRLEGVVDPSGPGAPVIRMRLVPRPAAGSPSGA